MTTEKVDEQDTVDEHGTVPTATSTIAHQYEDRGVPGADHNAEGQTAQAGAAGTLERTPLGELRMAPLAQRVAALELLTDAIAEGDPVAEQLEHSGPELGAASVRVHQVSERLIGKRLDWLAAEEADGRWATDGSVRTYAGFVARAHGISFSRAKALVRLARQLRDEIPEFRSALRAGKVGFEQVQILARGALTSKARIAALQDPVSEDLPGDREEQHEPLQDGGTDRADADADADTDTDADADADADGSFEGQTESREDHDSESAGDGSTTCGCSGGAAACTGACGDRATEETVERFLLRQAVKLRPEDLRRVVRYFAQVADPEADERGYKHAQEREFFQISRTLDGFHIAGFLTEEHGQQVKIALDAIMGTPPVDDTRSGAQRRAQALADMARTVLNQGLAGSHASVQPHMGVLIGPEQFRHILSTTGLNTMALSDTGEVAGSAFGAAIASGSAEEPDPTLTPPEGGWAALLSTPPASWTDGTGPVPPALLRRLASCSEVYRIIFSSEGEVINHGRAKRGFTPAQRRALIARDRHCTYPGCTAPPVLCESHHARIHWADGGPTDLANGALLCFYHHDLVDSRRIAMIRARGQWHFQLPDGRVIDRPRTPWVQRE